MFKSIEINDLKSINPNVMYALWIGAFVLVVFTFYVWKEIPSFLTVSIATFTALNLGFVSVLCLIYYPKIFVFTKIKNMNLGELKDYNSSLFDTDKKFRMDYLKKREVESVLVDLALLAGIKTPELLPLNFKPACNSTLNFNDPDDVDALDSSKNLKFFYLLDQILSTNHLDSVKISDFYKLDK